MIWSKISDNYCREARLSRARQWRIDWQHYLLLLVTAKILVLTGCSEPGREAGISGHAEYHRACSTCHARDGKGRPPTFPPLAGSEWLDMGPESVALVILVGLKGEIEVAGQRYRGYMPHMRQIQDAELASILGYISERWAGWEELPDLPKIAEIRAFAGDRPMLQSREQLEQLLQQRREQPQP